MVSARLYIYLKAITLLPLKAGIYAAIVALLSVKQATTGLSDLIIQAILDQLQTISQEASPIIGKNIMCFLGELMNVGLLTSVNFVEGLYDLEGGAESEM
jgi:nuclear cap-binding protein subunit 1